ncbi:hypothetical protein [Sulfurimonas sp.]|uniref:hypothetical protein n=1 Tax=Sulfurimonas sp. TaxID=2022749 RepID=UPI0026000583|nr:hypothetical protein [Sulfurimonas sp.]
MKLIFLVTILTTMLFSSQKQIIVGSFLQENNALNALVRLNSQILSDDKLSKLINKNSIEVEFKKMGQYNAISLSPFSNYVQLLRTLRALERHYGDAYVLDNGKKMTMTEVVSKVEVQEMLAPIEVETKVVEKIEKIEEKIEEKIKTDDVIIEKKVVKLKKVVPYVKEEKDYTYEIVLSLLVLLGAGFIIFKTSRTKKKDVLEEELT